MNFCPRCGSGTAPTDAFCGACGTPLTGGEYDYNGSANPYDAGAPVADAAYYFDGETNVGPSFWGSFGYCMKNYCNFRGRATRTEYWGWIVVNALFCWVLQLVALLGLSLGGGADVDAAKAGSDVVEGLWNLAVMLPALAVMGRRLHDVGWSAKQMLGPIVLGVVGLTLIIFGVGLENFETDDGVAASMGAVYVGLALIVPAAIWQLVLGITSGFVRGTDGSNRFGGKRWNPADVRR